MPCCSWAIRVGLENAVRAGALTVEEITLEEGEVVVLTDFVEVSVTDALATPRAAGRPHQLPEHRNLQVSSFVGLHGVVSL